MARYFKLTEIDRNNFIEAMGEDLDCSSLLGMCNGICYVAVDDVEEDELTIPLYTFDGECN